MAQRVVGLDIGTSAIRAVELTVDDGSRPSLVAFGQVGLAPGVMEDGEVRDRSQVVKAIQHLWRDGGFKERRVHIGVAGLRAITRELDMPPVSADELDEAVRFESDDVIPFPLEQTALSAKVVANFTDADGSPRTRVLLAAAHRDLVDGVVKAVTEAGLEPVGIDLDTAALARALHDPASSGRAEVIVSIGAGLTMVVVHQAGQLQFVRTIDLGGATFTGAIAGALDLPFADAERIKRQLAETSYHDPRAASALSTAVNQLVEEIDNSIRFYTSLPGREVPDRILVTGAGAQVTGFLEALQASIDIPVSRAAPLSMVDIGQLPISAEQETQINPTLAVPVGLALPDSNGSLFNLLPKEVVEARMRLKVRKILITCGVIVLALLIGGTAWRILGVRSAQNQVKSLTSQLTYINHTEIPKYDKVVALQKAVTSLQAKLRPLVAGEVDWLVVLNQFGEYLPKSASLVSLDVRSTGTPGEAAKASKKGTKSSTATSGTSATSASTSTTAPAKKSSKTSKTGTGSIGFGTASIDVPNLTVFSQVGDSMARSPAFTFGPPTGTYPIGNTIAFGTTFDVKAIAGTHRLSLFSTSIP